MADIIIEPDANTNSNTNSPKVGPVWTNDTTAYAFYPADGGSVTHSSLYYRKTTNGGATWSARVLVKTPSDYGIYRWSIWYDRWTPGETGTKIHIVYIDYNASAVFYRSLDTAGDVLSAEVLIHSGGTADTEEVVDITKARGGNLYCGYWIRSTTSGFKKSADDGATWNVCTTMADGAAIDIILLMPGNEADTNDIWCFYWDVSASEVSLKVYDSSGNSWSETLISASIVYAGYIYRSVDDISASQRHSDNHVILAVWSERNAATADLKVWDIGGAGSIVAKTNVLTNSDDSGYCAVFINQLNDDIYVAYIKGSAWNVTVNPFYKKSTDSGATWGVQMPLSESAEDDIRYVWAGHSVGSDCGYFMPVWVNEDLSELDTNIVNAVYICSPAPPLPPPPSPPEPTPEEELAEAAAPPFEILLYDRGMNLKAALFPLETGDCGNIQPISISWTRCWQDAGSFELVLPAQTPYLDDLMSLGSYIVFRRADTGAFEALYIIEHAELQIGIFTYILDTAEQTNAIYVGGQGTGTLRDCVVRTSVPSIALIGRLEGFVDARDVEKDQFDLLRLRADGELGKIKALGTLVAEAGEPAQPEIVTVSGRTLLFYCAKRVVLPPPATIDPLIADRVDIGTGEYDQKTGTADVVMKDYVNTHLIAPLDASRTVDRLVNQAAIVPLATITYQGRFQTVLEALQEICMLNTPAQCGMEVVLDAANQFEFQVLPQVDHTIGSGSPVVFRSDEVLLSIPGREYRVDWDIGDLVTLEIGDFPVIDLPILAVTVSMEAETARRISIAFDTPTVNDMDRFRRVILEANSANIKAARA